MTQCKPTRQKLAILGGLVCATALFTSANLVTAQAFRAASAPVPAIALVQAQAEMPETVRLLTGLATIESNLQLGLLYRTDGLTHPGGSPFARPRNETWPAIRDGILAAGGPDLEPLLAKLETAGDTAALADVSVGLAKARTALNPTAADLVAAIAGQSRALAAGLVATGPTAAHDYEDAWALLMVTRNQVDLLARNPDPAIAKAAADMAMALDEVIISIPDPTGTNAQAVDPAPILNAVTALETVGNAT